MNWDLYTFVNNQKRFEDLAVVFVGTGSCVYPSSATMSAMPSSTIPPATPTNVPASTIPPATPTNVPSSTIPPVTTSPGATGSTYGVPGSGYATSV